MSDDFRADLGFIPQVGYKKALGTAQYRWYNNSGWWSDFAVGISSSRAFDQQGNRYKNIDEPYFIFNGTRQTHVEFYYARVLEKYAGSDFDQAQAQWYASIQPLGDVSVECEGAIGTSIDYANVRPAESVYLSPRVSFNLGPSLYTSVSYTYERLDSNDAPLYDAKVTQLRCVYQFNIRTFVRAIVQYVDVNYNVGNYTVPVDPHERTLFTQFLFSYKLNPQTVFFLGYSDNARNFDEFGLTRTGRTVFMKLGYAWQM